jgi:hypothetical protein
MISRLESSQFSNKQIQGELHLALNREIITIKTGVAQKVGFWELR